MGRDRLAPAWGTARRLLHCHSRCLVLFGTPWLVLDLPVTLATMRQSSRTDNPWQTLHLLPGRCQSDEIRRLASVSAWSYCRSVCKSCRPEEHSLML
jgi:hypothetical protein